MRRGIKCLNIRHCMLVAMAMLAFLVPSFLLLPCVLPSRWFFVHRCHGLPHPWQSLELTSIARNTSVAVLTIADKFLEADPSLHLRSRLSRNRNAFCKRWNYTCMVIDTETMPVQQFPVAWSKLDFAELALTQHEFVFVIDADAVIMQSDVDIGILLNEMLDNSHSLAISPDINNVNSGIFILRQSPWTAHFFAEVRKIRPVLARQTITLPLKYENRAFFYLTGLWPTDCIGMSRVDTWLAPAYHNTSYFRAGVHMVDRCLLNTRPYNPPRLWDAAKSDASYDDISNAFIVHAAGGYLRDKLRVIHTLLERAGFF